MLFLSAVLLREIEWEIMSIPIMHFNRTTNKSALMEFCNIP